MEKKILSENSSHVYYTDGTIKVKTMKQAKTTKQPLEDSKEGLHTQGEKSFGNLELWEDSIEKDFFYSLKAYTKDGLQTIVRTETPLKKDKDNCEYILKAVNERQALLDSNKELLAALKQLHRYTSSKVKSYNIKDSTYFETINIMANGLHNKIK